MKTRIVDPTTGVAAPVWAWRALGYTVDTDGGLNGGPYGIEALFLAAVGRGLVGCAALGWIAEELARRREEVARAAAISAEAAAIEQLASALCSASEDDVLRKLLGRLTERTQCAVRAQLRIS